MSRALTGALAVLTAACVDQPVPLSPPGGGATASRLSALGIFQGEPAAQVPIAGFVPYQVNVSLYSDGAEKMRFVHVPDGATIHATADRWELPVGTWLVKTFYFPKDARDPSQGRQLIETRFLVKQASGFVASTYLWNEDQTDAIASGGNLDVSTDWTDANGDHQLGYFHVPGTTQCMTCHADRALGWRSRQLDHELPGADGGTNQVAVLLAAGVIDAEPPAHLVLSDPFGSGPLDIRARSYLDANCSHCHGAGGEAESTGLLWDLEHTGAGQLPLCEKTEAVDGDDQVIAPGDPTRSEFLARMLSPDAFVRMPQGPTHIPDGEAISVLSQWVAGMPPGCP